MIKQRWKKISLNSYKIDGLARGSWIWIFLLVYVDLNFFNINIQYLDFPIKFLFAFPSIIPIYPVELFRQGRELIPADMGFTLGSMLGSAAAGCSLLGALSLCIFFYQQSDFTLIVTLKITLRFVGISSWLLRHTTTWKSYGWTHTDICVLLLYVSSLIWNSTAPVFSSWHSGLTSLLDKAWVSFHFR